MPNRSNLNRKSVPLSFAFVLLVALTLTVGWVWFGWGYIAKNRLLMNSLPVPPNAKRVDISSNPISNDDSPLTPPNGWGTRATFRISTPSPQPPLPDPKPYALSPIAPFRFSSLSRQPVADFYISRLSPDWQHCVNVITATDGLSSTKLLDTDPPIRKWQEISGVRFGRGDAYVSINTDNIGLDGSGSFDIYVNHKDDLSPCPG